MKAKIINSQKLMFFAIKLREDIGNAATWCDKDEVGRYDLDTIINNLAAMNDPTLPTIKYLR
jgi:hypothetical protein